MIGILAAGIILVATTVSGFAQTDLAMTRADDTNVIAVVLGRKITAKESDNLNGLIFGTLLQAYARENKIEPTDAELDAFNRRNEEMNRRNLAKFEDERKRLKEELKSGSLSERDRQHKQSYLETIESILKTTRDVNAKAKGTKDEVWTRKRPMANHFVQAWKINAALYKEYGGRVIFQQAGVEPLDAYREFLKEEGKKGSFQILDKEYESTFWRYFTNDAMHVFCTERDGAKLLETPWWMMDDLQEE